MLPLVYLCYKLSRPDDLWPFSTWTYLTASSQAIIDRVPVRLRTRGSSWLEFRSVQLIRAGISTPCRVLKNLYELGRILDQNPSLLRARSRPTARENIHKDRAATISTIGSGHEDAEEVQAPATASQVYHAAILNGNTLDNLLADFETSDSTLADENGPQRDASDQKRSKYRNSSIQTTPDHLMSPRKVSSTAGADVQNIASVFEARPYGRIIKLSDSPATASNETDEHDDQPSPARSGRSVPVTDDEHPEHCNKSSPDLRACPTFVRRHGQSRLPRRPAQKERVVQHAVSAEPVLSTAAVDSGSPMKRNRLQRRTRAPWAGV